MRFRSTALTLTLTLVLSASPLLAQQKKPASTNAKPAATSSKPAEAKQAGTPAPGVKVPTFALGQTVIGPAIGIGGLGNASMSFGGRFEHAIKPLPDFGNGTLGIGVNLDYYSYTYATSGYKWSFRYVPISVTGNYHFAMPAEYSKWDPYFGLGLGYSIASVTGGGTATSDVYFVGTLGGRYFVNPRTAIQAEVGTGVANLNLGVMFRM